MNTILSEKEYQTFIIQRLLEKGYKLRTSDCYDRRFAMDPDLLFQFLEETQPQKMAKVKKACQEDYKETLLNFLNLEICKPSRSLIDVLKNGIEFANVKLDLLYTKPATTINEKLIAKANSNIFSVMEEVWASDKERIDLVIFLNGLAIISFELKCNQAGQNYTHAIHQYRAERNPKTRLFLKKAGCFVNFAMDLEECYMTTELRGLETYFLPFNIGRGEGINTGKGNPTLEENGGKFSVSYMWEDILTKETLYDLIGRFIFVETSEKKDEVTGKKFTVERPVFPRYHQLRCIRKLVADLVVNHTEQNYLIQHSAGSGKTKTIAWLAHRLVSLHDAEDKPIFDNIVIVTDRVVVDRQLQDAVRQIDHKSGLIKVMDDKSTSDSLRRALEGNTKIIATTIQKFLYIVESIRKINDKHFAVIIDEAHSSTAGKDMGALTQVLGKGQENDDELETDDVFTAEIRANGKQPNVSMFAFTATPKPTTLALFGRPGKSGKKEAFDLYSMKQAIEEEFILDVLSNYLEYKTYYDLNKVIEQDPKYKSGKAKKKIARLVDLTDENIEKRTEVIIEHFRSVVMEELGGTAKAMVVTASRPAAVKYKQAFEKYIREHEYSDLKCFVAFSGKVKLEGDKTEYTEVGLNGISEKALPETFAKDENRILLVANKYQTGFDQPRLCAMYVLKTLKSIAAVQTLSRLNRICPPYKKKTFVLDFCNTYEDIVKAFKPYYTATILDNDITPSEIYKVETKLDGFNVLDDYDIENYSQLITIAKPSEKQKMQMLGYLQKAERRANDLAEDDKKEFVANLKRFVRFYEFVIQASQFEDVELHKKYKFCSSLQSWFKKDQSGEGFSLKDQIVANNFLNKLQGEHTKNTIVADPFVKLPTAETQLSEDEEKKLSQIIEEINNRTGNKFDKDVAAKSMLQIKEILLKSKALQQSALVNSEDEFKFKYYEDIDEALLQGLEQNQDFFSMLLNNSEIKKQVMGVFVSEVYKTLKNKEYSVSDSDITGMAAEPDSEYGNQ